jgi:hypothetical protein
MLASPDYFILSAGTELTWGSSGVASVDLRLTRDASNTLGQRNAANAQTFNIYNTFTSSTNHERGFLKWSSNVFQIGTEKGSGGGTARGMAFQTDGVTRMTLGATDGILNINTIGAAGSETSATITHGRGNNGDAVGIRFLPRGSANTSAWVDVEAVGTTGPSAYGTLRSVAATRGAWGLGSGLTTREALGFSAPSPFAEDLVLARDAANILGQRNGTSSQAFRLYNTSSSGNANFERLNIRWASNECTIDAEAGGSGTSLRGIKIGSATSSLLGFYGVTPVDQPATVTDPTGGGTQDAEARTAINDIIDRLQELGLIA